MREIKELFNREFRDDRIDNFEENTNVFSSISDTNNFTVKNLADNQPAIYDNKLLFKTNGNMKELIIDNGSIILKEI